MERIIVVDDERLILEEMEEELVEQGWEVDAFDHPMDALKSLKEKSYTIGVFDIKMPEMSGVELLEKAQAWQHDMDVIFITARPELDTAIKAVQLGVCDYLYRPFELRELVQVINRTLTHRSLRLENAVLSKRLEMFKELSDGIQSAQTLVKTLDDTLNHVALAISPDYLYAAFICAEHFDPVIACHGVSAEQIGLVNGKLPGVKSWLNQVLKVSLRIPDITQEPECPLNFGSRNELLLAPIFHQQKLLGALFCSTSGEDKFSLHDERFLVATANLVGHVVVGVITQDKLSRAEDQLRQQQTAEYLRAVAGGVAHDLKTPLSIIGGQAQYVMRTIDQGHPSLEHLKNIQKQAYKADESINELLGFCYRTDVMAFEESDLNALVEEMMQVLREANPPTHIQLVSKLASAPIEIECDILQLKRALRNVIENAIRYTDRDGTITVTTKKGYGSAQIRVHNSGEPIPKENWQDIFKPHITGKTNIDGPYRSGYGLPVARGILMGHGGNIEVESSTKETGTVFLIAIPIKTNY